MTKAKEIVQNFLFKIDPNATYPREEILEKFVHRLNIQRNPKRQPTPYGVAFVASVMERSQIKNAALLCWFYNHCASSRNFTETWHNLTANIETVDKAGD